MSRESFYIPGRSQNEEFWNTKIQNIFEFNMKGSETIVSIYVNKFFEIPKPGEGVTMLSMFMRFFEQATSISMYYNYVLKGY